MRLGRRIQSLFLATITCDSVSSTAASPFAFLDVICNSGRFVQLVGHHINPGHRVLVQLPMELLITTIVIIVWRIASLAISTTADYSTSTMQQALNP